jgi:hypothetical protein
MQIRGAAYVCEDNLVSLMDFQIAFGRLWTNMLPSFISARMLEYNRLQLELNSLISRMQWAILLQRMKNKM